MEDVWHKHSAYSSISSISTPEASLMSVEVEVEELFYKDVSLCDQQLKGILVLGTKT